MIWKKLKVFLDMKDKEKIKQVIKETEFQNFKIYSSSNDDLEEKIQAFKEETEQYCKDLDQFLANIK